MGNTDSQQQSNASSKELLGSEEGTLETSKQLLEQFIRSAFKSITISEAKNCAEQLMEDNEIEDFDADVVIAKKGGIATHMFIILSGSADMLIQFDDDSDYHTCKVLEEGDVIGDVSVLFNRPALHTVRTNPGCRVLALSASRVRDVLADIIANSGYTIHTWLIMKKQLPIPILDDLDLQTTTEISAKIVFKILRKVPLCESWHREHLEALVSGVAVPHLCVYPAEVNIVEHGESGGTMLVVIKGRIAVNDADGKRITDINVSTTPFCFGEEGLFHDGWCYPYSIEAVSVCQVIPVMLEEIQRTNELWMEDHPDERSLKPWHTAQDLWTSIIASRPQSLYSKFETLLQVELYFHQLYQSGHFPAEDFSPTCIYSIALSGHIETPLFGKKLKVEKEVSFVLIIGGKLLPMVTDGDYPNLWGPGDLIDCENSIPASELAVCSAPCVVVMFLTEDILQIRQKFSETNLVYV